MSAGGKSVDFRNADFSRQLTRALLAVDFDLHVELPADRLVPAVPQRLNYLHWVEDLVSAGALSLSGEQVHGMDIGEYSVTFCLPGISLCIICTALLHYYY